jgi:hypothetical protein
MLATNFATEAKINKQFLAGNPINNPAVVGLNNDANYFTW